MKYKLYTIDNKFIEGTDVWPLKFTGIIKYPNGSKGWYNIEGKLHRLDGPAYERYDGSKEWYIDGRNIICQSNEQFLLFIDIMRLKGLI